MLYFLLFFACTEEKIISEKEEVIEEKLPVDCAGLSGGSAVEDNCGECDDDPNNDCVQDCNGEWGGSALEDNCGECDINPANDCVQDCNEEWGGTAVEDNCGTCDSDPSNDCVQDCNEEWGGTAVEDDCGTCDSDPSNDCSEVIVLYQASSNGNMGGRTGADALCTAELANHASLSGFTAHALLCPDQPDEAMNFPVTLGIPDDVVVSSLNGSQLASNWQGLMAGLDMSLQDAGVFSGNGWQQFFTGCKNSSASSGCVHNCSGFTTANASVSACVGRTDYTDNDWIAWGNILSCEAERSFLCLAYGYRL